MEVAKAGFRPEKAVDTAEANVKEKKTLLDAGPGH